MPNEFRVQIRRGSSKNQVILFIHGFSGDAHLTFGMLPAFIAGDRNLMDWDLCSFGYPTSLAPDISGVWTADPDLTTLAGLLRTFCNTAFFGYTFAIIAHSMGGLVAQKAILDPQLAKRTSHLVLFGTPSNGLRKAGLARLFKRQARDMTFGGEFVTTLRSAWTQQFSAGLPFVFRAVAGVKDEFVPVASSVGPFPGFDEYVNGNHLEIVKPESAESDSVLLLEKLLAQTAGQTFVSPLKQKAQAQIGQAAADPATLSDEQVVDLAFSMELAGQQDKAVEMLQGIYSRSTELTSVLAGRLKRRWLADPEAYKDDGTQAYNLYESAFKRAADERDRPQAFYAAINVAFLALAVREDENQAAAMATSALDHCRQSAEEKWQLATQGEANLYLRNTAAALRFYEQALASQPNMREIDSMRKQAIWAARLLKDSETESRLDKLFDAGPRWAAEPSSQSTRAAKG